jgi:nucleotide-binding universal stress UspA family protein
VDAVARGVASSADPADVILAEARSLGASMIAVGATGHGALHTMLLGSASRGLIKACPCPLFVHH